MQKIRFKKTDGKFVIPCPYGKRDENTQTLFNVGSRSCRCDCPYFEGIRISEGVVYCLGSPGINVLREEGSGKTSICPSYRPFMTHENVTINKIQQTNIM